jgi:selenocysteine lyase/cysteine desulfurase
METYPAGTIRFSVSYFTTEEDFEELITALDDIEESM